MSDRCSLPWPDWPELLQRLRRELALLGEPEAHWLRDRLAAIETAQLALDDLFREANGHEACSGCDGSCCACGRHHITLTNLFAYLLAGEDPPAPDPGSVCPYLSDQGCRLPAARRPYNCITFFCETLEEGLTSGQREQLRTLDGQLRREYLRIEKRYPAATLRGLWVALQRLDSDQILRSTGQDVLE